MDFQTLREDEESLRVLAMSTKDRKKRHITDILSINGRRKMDFCQCIEKERNGRGPY